MAQCGQIIQVVRDTCDKCALMQVCKYVQDQQQTFDIVNNRINCMIENLIAMSLSPSSYVEIHIGCKHYQPNSSNNKVSIQA